MLSLRLDQAFPLMIVLNLRNPHDHPMPQPNGSGGAHPNHDARPIAIHRAFSGRLHKLQEPRHQDRGRRKVSETNLRHADPVGLRVEATEAIPVRDVDPAMVIDGGSDETGVVVDARELQDVRGPSPVMPMPV